MTPDTIMLDIVDRLARIEVKIDKAQDTQDSHGDRLTEVEDKVAVLETELAASRARMALVEKIGAGLVAIAGMLAWVFDKLPIG